MQVTLKIAPESMLLQHGKINAPKRQALNPGNGLPTSKVYQLIPTLAPDGPVRADLLALIILQTSVHTQTTPATTCPSHPSLNCPNLARLSHLWFTAASLHLMLSCSLPRFTPAHPHPLRDLVCFSYPALARQSPSQLQNLTLPLFTQSPLQLLKLTSLTSASHTCVPQAASLHASCLFYPCIKRCKPAPSALRSLPRFCLYSAHSPIPLQLALQPL
jgi:hypothetical protein